MPRKPAAIQSVAEQAGTTEPVNAAETVIATLPGISPDGSSPRILLEGSCNVIQGATAATAVLRIRRGSTTAGTLVTAALTSAIAAAGSIGLSITSFDQPAGELASQPYVLTIECPAATSNPKVTGAVLAATF